MTTKDVLLESRAEDNVNVVDDDDDYDDDDNDDEHTKDLHLPCLLDSVHTESVTDLCSPHIFLDDPFYSSQSSSNTLGSDNWNVPEEPTVSISLVVADKQNGARLKKVIGPCLVEHTIHTCTYDEAYDMCSKTAYYMIWFYLGRPIDQDILAHTTSIRYASKTSRNTIIVGVTPAQLSDDLGLHGLAEIVVEPITKPYIFTKYRRWASLTIKDEKPVKTLKIEKAREDTSSNMATTISLHNNTTIELPIVTTKPIECNSNISVMPSSFLPPSIEKNTNRTNMVPPLKHDDRPRSRSSSKTSSPSSPKDLKSKNCMAADHTIKEKMRRERIKDSCDQLRVLLPYIRGRKTDMASILEMTVDYLKLITSALPPDFQSQIVAMMATGTLDENSYSKSDPCSSSTSSSASSSRRSSRSKDPTSPSLSKVTSSSDISMDSTGKMADIEADINENQTDMNSNKIMSHSESSPRSFSNPKRTDGIDVTDTMHAKRMMMSSGPAQSNMLYITTDDNRKECGITIDNTHDDVFQGHIQSMRVPQTHWSDMYSMSGYPQLAGPAGSRMTACERDNYGMFMDSYYHYYTGQQQSSGYGGNPLSDYVNPNAVLPMTYTRMPENSRAYDDNDRFSGGSQGDDVYSMSSTKST